MSQTNNIKSYANSLTPEYKAWSNMRTRCLNKNHPHYDKYGGRGIQICEEWNTFTGFLEDMGKRPTPKHTLDRTNNNGNYEPGNCRWATWTQQGHNRRGWALSGFKNITYREACKTKPWHFRVKKNGKIYCKSFKTLEEAKQACAQLVAVLYND